MPEAGMGANSEGQRPINQYLAQLNDFLKTVHVQPIAATPLDDQTDEASPRQGAFNSGIVAGAFLRGFLFGAFNVDSNGVELDDDDDSE